MNDRPGAPPLVSLILLSYNYERYVGRAIESVLAQSCPAWELVVVDDGSTDRSLEVIRPFADADSRVKVLALAENQGAGHAYNHAYARCRGEYVGSLDADDYLAPRRLERQLAWFTDHPQVDVVGTFVTQVDGSGEPIDGIVADWCNQERDLDRPESWALRNYLCHSSVLLRRSAHDRVGAFSTDLVLAPDYDLWLRCFVHGCRFAIVPEPLTYHRTHGANASDTCDQGRLFLELAYLFTRYVAPHVVGGRNDLLDRCLRYFTSLLGEADLEDRLVVLRELALAPLHPREAAAFLIEFPARCGEAWPRARAALPGPQPASRQRPVTVRRRRGPVKSRRLVVVDDCFPEITTSFRVAEFNHYLDNFDCTVYSTNPAFDDAHRVYSELHPRHAGRVRRFAPAEAADARLVYFTFLVNAHQHLPWLEHHELPFAFTLYPGAGLQLHEAVSELRLAAVGGSPLLRRVIVTQQVVYDYVMAGGFFPPEKVELIYGGVFPADYYRRHLAPRSRYPGDKDTLDVCFVAFKYIAGGVDKGYDTFLGTARELAKSAPQYRFHVVGNFSPADLPIDGLDGRITFHPPQATPFFPRFYAGMDVILSPNVPFRLGGGAFDGFPTGCAVEAALCGVAVVCSDELGENRWFRADEEICIVPPRVEPIVRRIDAYRRDPDLLHRLAAAGQRRCADLFGTTHQLDRRRALLAAEL